MSHAPERRSALADLRVIEIAHERSCYAAKQFADMGADVIVVEPPDGARVRQYEPFLDDEPGTERSLYWWHYNTSKRGITLDLGSNAGRSLFRRLIARADLLIEGEDPGRLAALEFDYPDLRKIKPDLIHVSITPFGRAGPRAQEQATDLTLMASAGPVWSSGYDDHSIPPVRFGGNQGYHTGAAYAVMGAMVALLVRDQTGRGQLVECSINAACNVTTENGSYEWLVARGTVQRQTGRHAQQFSSLPTQIMCADGRWANSGTAARRPRQLKALYEWLVELDLEQEFPESIFVQMGGEKQDISESQIGQDDEVTAIFSAAREGVNLLASRLTAEEFFDQAQARNIQVAMILTPEEVMENRHFRARGFPTEVEHPELGRSFEYPGAPYKFGGSPWCISRRAPLLGEHNNEVLGELLSSDELDILRSQGVI